MYDDFGLTEEQLAMQTLARKFAQEHIRPIAAKIDDMPVSEKKNGKPVLVNGFPAISFPWDMVKEAHKIGFKCIAMPEEYGGQDADVLIQTIIKDELGYECVACSKTISQQWKIPQTIVAFGTKDQKDRFLGRLRDEPTYLICGASTEPEGASDNQIPYDGPEGGMKMSVEKKKGGYVLNGTKTFIALGAVASLAITGARTDKTKPVRLGQTRFLVPHDSPGYSIIQAQNKSGFRAYPNGELGYDNVFVPEENMLGKWNEGAKGAPNTVGQNEVELAADAVAMCRSAYDKALDYAKTRVQGGKPIIQHELIGGLLADAYMWIQTGRALVWKASWDASHERRDPMLSMACGRWGSQLCQKVLPDMLSIFGGSGVMKELPMEKYIRDALIYKHLADSTAKQARVQNMLIGRPGAPA